MDCSYQLDGFSHDIQLEIARILPPEDLSAFRLVCRAFADVGGSALLTPAKLSRIYLHATSIPRFIDICNDADIALRIDTVVILGMYSPIQVSDDEYTPGDYT